MAHIQPIQIPFQGTANYLHITSMPYALGVDLTTGLQWALMEETITQEPVLTEAGEQELDEAGEPVTVEKKEYKPLGPNGTFALTEEEFGNWGTDDSYIIQLIAYKLGVVLV
jgi:hypothetical protein